MHLSDRMQGEAFNLEEEENSWSGNPTTLKRGNWTFLKRKRPFLQSLKLNLSLKLYIRDRQLVTRSLYVAPRVTSARPANKHQQKTMAPTDLL